MSALDPRKPLVRFEDRTRWAPMCFIDDKDSRPIGYHDQFEAFKHVSRIVTSIIYRIANRKDPL